MPDWSLASAVPRSAANTVNTSLDGRTDHHIQLWVRAAASCFVCPRLFAAAAGGLAPPPQPLRVSAHGSSLAGRLRTRALQHPAREKFQGRSTTHHDFPGWRPPPTKPWLAELAARGPPRVQPPPTTRTTSQRDFPPHVIDAREFTLGEATKMRWLVPRAAFVQHCTRVLRLPSDRSLMSVVALWT